MIAARLAWEDEAAPLIENLRRFQVTPNAKELAFLETKQLDDPTVDCGLTAFLRLGTERQRGFDIGPIPVTAIETWAERHFIDPIVADFFTEALLVADREWLKAVHAKQSASAPKPPKGKQR